MAHAVCENQGDQLPEVKDASSIKSPGLGIRHLQIILMFFGMMIGYSLRVSLSVTIVAMSNSSTANTNFKEYGWDPVQRGQILSSFFWGYTVMQIPSGYLATVWSGQKLLAFGIVFCGALNLLIPFAAEHGDVIGVMACRIGMGLCQACLLPCVHTLLSKWVPPSERARLGVFAYAGAQLGTVISLPLSGLLAASIGWPSVFYVFGSLSIIWGFIFYVWGSNTPGEHRTISIKERQYIETSLQINTNADGTVQKLRTPWKEIFTSLPMWALIVAHCGQNWGYWILLTEMPSYMSSILKFDIEKNGLYSALPYLAMWILSFPVSALSDYALSKNVSRAITRKVCNTIAHWGPALALIVLCFVPASNQILSVIVLIVAVGLNAGSLCGFQLNHIDLSPNYAGTMMAITNCIASVVAIVVPMICGVIVEDENNSSQWHIVFYMSAVIYFLGNLIFILFGKAETQWWNNPETVDNRREEKIRMR